MSSLNINNDPYKLLVDFYTMISKYNSIAASNKLKDRFLRWYTEAIKYPLFRRRVGKVMEKNITACYHNPPLFLEVLTRMVASIVHLVEEKSMTVDDLVRSIYADNYMPLRVVIIKDAIEKDKIIKFNIRISNLSHVPNFYYHKMTVTDIEIDIRHGMCTVHMDIFDSDDYIENTSTYQPIESLNFNVSSTGELVNPTYVFNKEFAKEDYERYAKTTLIIFAPFVQIMNALTTCHFITHYNTQQTKKEDRP